MLLARSRPAPTLLGLIQRHHSTHPNFSLKDPSLLSTSAWISGRPTPALSNKTYALIDPATGKQWHEMAALGVVETDQAIKAAHEAFPAFSAIPGRTRGKMIMEMDRLFREAKGDLGQMAVMECGKTLKEAEGEVEVGCESSPSLLLAKGDMGRRTDG